MSNCRYIYVLLLLCLCILSRGDSQATTLIKIIAPSDKVFACNDKKITDIDSKLDKKVEKYLAKLQK